MLIGRCAAAQKWLALKQRYVPTTLGQRTGRSQPRQSAADNANTGMPSARGRSGVICRVPAAKLVFLRTAHNSLFPNPLTRILTFSPVDSRTRSEYTS